MGKEILKNKNTANLCGFNAFRPLRENAKSLITRYVRIRNKKTRWQRNGGGNQKEKSYNAPCAWGPPSLHEALTSQIWPKLPPNHSKRAKKKKKINDLWARGDSPNQKR